MRAWTMIGVLVVLGAAAVLTLRSCGPREQGLDGRIAERWERIRSLPGDEGPAAFTGWLTELDEQAAVRVIEQLAAHAGAGVLPCLPGPLGQGAPADARDGVRRAAVSALGRVGEPDGQGPILREMLRGDESVAVRSAAAQALGTWYDWESMPEFVAGLRDPSPVIRGRSYAAIRRILGSDFRFRANDPPDVREPIVRRIESEWRGYHDDHLAHMQRLNDKGKAP